MHTYFMTMFNGHITEELEEVPAKLVSVDRSIQGVRKTARLMKLDPHEHSVFRCWPKFEASSYDFKDFEKDEEDEGTPLSKYVSNL